MQKWYLHRNGQQYGPYSFEQLQSYAETRQCLPDDLVWSEGMAEWVKASTVEGLFGPPVPPLVPAPPPPAPAAPVQNESFVQDSNVYNTAGTERIMGIIPAMDLKTGLVSQKHYNLVVTEQRIVFAEATNQMLSQAAKEAAEEAKASGKGFLARAADTMRSGQRIYQKYWQMNPEAILAETGGNFPVWFNEITSVKINQQSGLKIGFGTNTDQDQIQKDSMDIKTMGQKYKLTFSDSRNTKEARQLLKSLLPNRVR